MGSPFTIVKLGDPLFFKDLLTLNGRSVAIDRQIGLINKIVNCLFSPAPQVTVSGDCTSCIKHLDLRILHQLSAEQQEVALRQVVQQVRCDNVVV